MTDEMRTYSAKETMRFQLQALFYGIVFGAFVTAIIYVGVR